MSPLLRFAAPLFLGGWGCGWVGALGGSPTSRDAATPCARARTLAQVDFDPTQIEEPPHVDGGDYVSEKSQFPAEVGLVGGNSHAAFCSLAKNAPRRTEDTLLLSYAHLDQAVHPQTSDARL